MNRGEFIRNLGLSSAALMSFYCMGTLTSCSKGSDPAPATTGTGTGTTTSGLTGNADSSAGKVDFTLDLTNATYSGLKTEGNFIKIGSVLVANVKGGNYVTIQRLCTHQGTDNVGYQLAANQFHCDAHGSNFKTDGTVINGPATNAMKLYKSTLSADKNKLQITE